MLLNEIFQNYQPEISDNAKCGMCGSTFTIPLIQLKRSTQCQCPSCKQVNDCQDAVTNYKQQESMVASVGDVNLQVTPINHPEYKFQAINGTDSDVVGRGNTEEEAKKDWFLHQSSRK